MLNFKRRLGVAEKVILCGAVAFGFCAGAATESWQFAIFAFFIFITAVWSHYFGLAVLANQYGFVKEDRYPLIACALRPVTTLIQLLADPRFLHKEVFKA